MNQSEALYIVSAMLDNSQQTEDELIVPALTLAKRTLQGATVELETPLVNKLVEMKANLERWAQAEREQLYAMGALLAGHNNPKAKMAQALDVALCTIKQAM